MLITSLLELHIRTTQSAVPSVFIMQSEQLYKRKFLKKPFDSFLLRYDYKALFFRNGVFFCPESFSRRKKSGHSSVTYASEPVSVFCISVILFDYKNVIQLEQFFLYGQAFTLVFALTQWNGQLRLQQFFAERRLSRE